VKTHRRTELLAFFESRAGSIFDLATKPASRAAPLHHATRLALRAIPDDW
jgi:hypothetical protein